MKEEIISNILEAKNLFELADELKTFLEFTDDLQEDKNEVLFELYGPLYSWHLANSFYSTKPYIIFEESAGIRAYLQARWQFHDSYRKNRTSLLSVINEIRKNIINPSGPRITAEDIKSIIDALDQRLSFVEKVLRKMCIEIVMLDHSHVGGNSFICTPKIDGIQYCMIMATHIHRESPDSEQYSFMHELGHALHFALTGSFSLPPKGFDQIHKTMVNEEGIPIANESMCELFADCFVMAATLCPPLEKYNSYEMLSGKDKIFITAYMMHLIDSIK